MRYLYLIILIISFSFPSLSQIISKNINYDDWSTEKTEEYEGVYQLGESEAEYKLRLIKPDNTWISQIEFGEWSHIDNKPIWISNYVNISNISIIKNIYYSDQIKAVFIIYPDKTKGIKILNLGAKTESYTYGVKINNLDDEFPGKYNQASLTYLYENKLKLMNKKELRIMRNEIFARYGFIFKPDEKMDRYFSKQTWYKKQHNKVSHFLTTIEKYNIKLILKVENSKK
ncbi:MAG: YARHG domain-containing protein [Marinifilaceae bacterium]|jgi:hypothetical protein|nr:YARHG domain-containing protein [Marinifilaceae bacterium]